MSAQEVQTPCANIGLSTELVESILQNYFPGLLQKIGKILLEPEL